MAQENAKSQSAAPRNSWWRWLVLPFAAILGATAATLVVLALQWLSVKVGGPLHEDGWYYRFIGPALAHGFFGYVYAWIACAVAPSHKVLAGCVATALIGAVGGWALLLGWRGNYDSVEESIFLTICGVILFLAAGYAVLQVKRSRTD